MTDRIRHASLVLALAVSTLSPSAVAAQLQPLGEPSAYRFYTSHDGRFLMVDDADVDRDLGGNVGVLFDYGHRPFALDDVEYLTLQAPSPSGTELDLNGGTAVLQVHGAIELFSRLRIGVSVPFILYTFGNGYGWGVTIDGMPRRQEIPSGNGGGVGDPRIHALGMILDPDETGFLGLSLAAWVTLPFGQATLPNRFVGEPTVSFGGHLILSAEYQGFHAALNVGGSWREAQQIIESRRTSEFYWGLGARYDIDPMWGVLAEIVMQTTFGQEFDDEAPTEVRVAGSVHVGDVQIIAGLGFGIAYAVGVPVVRAFVGGTFTPSTTPDSDRDGVDDNQDACPGDAEDADGRIDEDGCPDVDDDEDGIPDETDRCPAEAEDADGNADEDGCPDADDDGDGVTDGYDSCPSVPEDRDGDRDTDGCPDDDADRDHIEDGEDLCPSQPEDTDGLADEDGCPEDDFDSDGVADTSDECADQAEDDDGFEDEDGCPEEGRGRTGRTRRRAR